MRYAILTIFVAGAFLTCGLDQAIAQTYTWNGGGADSNWSTSGNWSSPPPVGGSSSTAIVLNGTTRTTTNQDLGNPFLLNSLALNTDGSATSGFVITGGQLQFTGAGANITVNTNGPSQPGNPLVIRSALDISSNALSISLPSASGDINNPYEALLSGALTGTGTITQNGSAIGSNFVLAGHNSAFAGTYTVTGTSTLVIGANDALNRQSIVNLNSSLGGLTTLTLTSTLAGTSNTAYSLAIGSLSGTSGGSSLALGDATNFSTLLTGFNNDSNDIYAGTISMSGSGSHFGKVGTGTQTLSASSTNTQGSISVRDGSLILSGSGNLGSTSTSPVNSLSISIYSGASSTPAELRTVTGTSTNSRIQNNAAINIGGGLFHINASGLGTSATGYVEIVGGLTLLSGQSTIQVDASTNSGAGLQFSSYSAGTNEGTVFFKGNSLGSSPVSVAGTSNITFSTSPTLVGGGGSSGQTNISILPSGFGSSTGSGTTPDSLVTIGANGVRPLTSAEYLTSFSSGSTLTDNVSLSGSVPTLNAATTINALLLPTSVTLNVTSVPLTITSGVLLNTSSSSSISSSGTLLFGASGTSTAYITVTNTLNIGLPITASNLSKSGAGNLILNNSVSLGSNPYVAVNAGTLTLGGSASFSSSGTLTYQVSAPATLDATAVGLNLTSNQILQGNGSVLGTVTVGNGGIIAPSALGGPSSSLASPGTLSTGTLTLLGGGSYVWYVGSETGGLYTSNKITGTTLNINSTSANPFIIKLTTLAASNSLGAIYDFDPTVINTWTLSSFTTVNGFAVNKFSIDTSNFQNSLAGGSFSISLANSNQNLVLTFTPAPEQGFLVICGFALLGISLAVRSNRRQSSLQGAARAFRRLK
ncbi:hypothetical protein KIH39_06555 [Telmatocola sphagniphila]|uniref:PEP-CTERM protein-sorting domain-containing protein n=1 Tax=Telmatocola sphagniphila TaxID=1123043 RepID=A0A8E6B801_9BACT|nr:hypothetical protein [Telmatocola sphagniphila]QVL33568.1 hypothetical protein KIH39_06555 [Telmatocola sphagniphila]